MPQAVLMFADTTHTAAMRNEIPHSVHDPFLYIELGEERHTVLRSLEVARMSELPRMHAHAQEEFGLDELIGSGLSGEQATLEIALRACKQLEIDSAIVPPAFPLELADHLRAGGIELTVDAELFARRRRAKSATQLEGIKRAQTAAEAAVASVARALHDAEVVDGGLVLDGAPLTCERLKEGVALAFIRNGCGGDDVIVAHGYQTCVGHHSGSGQVMEGEPVTVDLCPRDPETGCYTDITRTFVKGAVNEELALYWKIVKQSIDAVLAAIRPGLPVRELHRISCEPIAAAGQPTRLTKKPGEVLNEGFFHSLGHGVGLEIHEAPHLDQNDDVLVAGDVIAVEPGCYRQGFGGVRLEDLVLVTESGGQLLTDYPYELTPAVLTRGVAV
ncbi:M24 family metallopeptidase [Conexibacter sp. JD483]|uniref:M24 family metallopeptidase n=1 Tax=unclassified Conexibacter TaxID=2627773 RepID=UPI00271DF366|nr:MULTISPECIES: M24 family metallopeptidase [unclassified Conexibacter]MDO8185584.1 M24 family metallopeptidase [Conexibacter sp. CPCC 205706]MDO8198757.1 M24 family metallopeptidase [Conexibacter sp. CPCC 205762]MDR9367893.1 M24 family metallopeptidase [Conexibacter sp. JD483]